MKNKAIIVLLFILGLIIESCMTVYATSYFAKDIAYKDGKNVEQALNELYSKKNNNLYLYWKGNTYDNITGGWESTLTLDCWSSTNGNQTTKKNAVLESNYIDLSTDSAMQNCVINTKNKLNLSEYNYVSICYTMSTNYASYMTVTSNLSSGNYAAFDNNNPGSSVSFWTGLSSDSRLHILTIPFSCSSEGYVTFHTLRGVSSDALTDLKIYGIYLSKTIDP